MRLSLAFTLASLSFAAACGDDGGPATTPDAAVNPNGFTMPTVSLKANNEVSNDKWEELGPANLSCLNMPSSDQPSTVEVTLNLQVTDFQTGQLVPNGTVTWFKNQDHTTVEQTVDVDGDGNLTLTIDAGTSRFGYKMESADAMPTFLLNQTLDSTSEMVQPSNTPPCMDGNTVVTCRHKIQSVSKTTASTLAALIGQTRTPGTGVVAGALRDCDGHEISGFVATMSSTSVSASPIDGAEAYYFDSSIGLPVNHRRAAYASQDGLFMIIEVPTSAPMGYVQMWGFPTDADLAMGEAGFKLIAELQVPILPETVITGSYEPLRTP